jgi:hypothetical protein
LEELTAQELLVKLLDKLGWLDPCQVVSFVRLTGSGLLVRIDDAVLYGMQHEDSFLLQTIKGMISVCAPCTHVYGRVSLVLPTLYLLFLGGWGREIYDVVSMEVTSPKPYCFQKV